MLKTQVNEQVLDDGMHFELSPMYQKIVLEDLMRAAIVLRDSGFGEHAEAFKLQQMCDCLYSMERGIDRTPLFNDCLLYTSALNEKDGPVFKIARDPRNTRVGRVLRKASLDEAIQFFDVLTGKIPLRILKTRPEFSEESMGAFALPAKSSTNKEQAFSQVASCFASGLRMRRISKFNCNRIRGMEAQFLAKPVFGAVCA